MRVWFTGVVVTSVVTALATTTLAHGPGREHRRVEPPPDVQTAPGPPLDPSLLETPPAGASTAAVPTTGVRSLRQLLADAPLVVLGTTTGTQVFDQGRLHVHRLRVDRVLAGDAPARDIGIVDVRGASQRPPMLADDARVVVLLGPAPPLSYLREQAGDERLYALAGGRDGIVPIASDADVEAMTTRMADAAAVARLDGAEALAARRRLAFSGLAASNPRLVADGVVELRQLGRLSRLTDDERDTIGRVFRDTAIPGTARAALATLLAERGAKDALPALLAAEADTPAVLDALLAARRRLGAPATAAELKPLLASDDPGVRAAALHALASTGEPDVVTMLERAASADPDAGVRGAAIDALGATGRTAALPVLSGTFASTERDIQQRSARAILAIGGTAADDALVTLALKGDRPETRAYAALMLLASRGAGSDAVQRLKGAKPPPEVVRVLEHGLEFRGAHHHD